ncbi:MAG: glycosyltransferase, partial [Anaerolineaceae bacterium]|nr:glycosyltransferase [Anaerolineaceae bacterium]
MKITCIAASRVPSSTANSIQAMKVCHALAELGHLVTLLLPDGHAPGPDDRAARQWENLRAHYGLTTPFDITWISAAPTWKRYDFAWNAVRAARKHHTELVYTWTAQASLLALIQGLPTLLEVHDRLTGRLGPLVFRLYRRWPGKKRTLVITQALARVLEREYGGSFPAGELCVAPNGVDLEHYTGLPEPGAARKALGMPEAITAVYTGHFYAGRGMDVLLGLALRYPQVCFLWVGGRSEDVERWRLRLKKAGLSNVTLTGFVENYRLPLYQAAGDILLMPYEQIITGSSGGNSVDICSPMKMFDYLAAGRAIISSDLPVI